MVRALVSFQGCSITVNFPQGEDIGLFLATPDLEPDDPGFLYRGVAQLAKHRLRFVGILGSEREHDGGDEHGLDHKV